MNAEIDYLFRHALLRDAAYDLQLPGDREALHALVVRILEGMPGGVADAQAAELAEHARLGSRLTPELARIEVKYLKRAAGYAGRMFLGEDAIRTWRRISEHPSAESAEKCEAQLQVADQSYRHLGRDAAEAEADRSLQAARKAGDQVVEARTLNLLGTLNRMRGDGATAEANYRSSLDKARATGEPEAQVMAAINLGYLYDSQGRFEEAWGLLGTALAEAQNAGLKRLVPAALQGLANIELSAGRRDQALEYARQAHEGFADTGNAAELAMAKGTLANMLRAKGPTGESAALRLEGISVARAAGARHALAGLLNDHGLHLKEQGELTGCEEALEEALRLHRERGDAEGVITPLINLGKLRQQQGRLEEARALLREGHAIAARAGLEPTLARIEQMEALIAYEEGDKAAAAAGFRRAIRRLEEAGEGRLRASTLSQLGQLEAERGNFETARDLFRQARRLREEGGDQAASLVELCRLSIAEMQSGNTSKAQALWNEGIGALRTGDHQQELRQIEKEMREASAETGTPALTMPQ